MLVRMKELFAGDYVVVRVSRSGVIADDPLVESVLRGAVLDLSQDCTLYGKMIGGGFGGPSFSRLAVPFFMVEMIDFGKGPIIHPDRIEANMPDEEVFMVSPWIARISSHDYDLGSQDPEFHAAINNIHLSVKEQSPIMEDLGIRANGVGVDLHMWYD